MIFTGQVWNMTFSFYHSMRAIPPDLLDAAKVYRFGWWRRFTRVELPYSTVGLVWNGMMSMAGGWFFLTINEAFRLGDHDFRLPGVGAYMSVAIDRGDRGGDDRRRRGDDHDDRRRRPALLAPARRVVGALQVRGGRSGDDASRGCLRCCVELAAYPWWRERDVRRRDDVASARARAARRGSGDAPRVPACGCDRRRNRARGRRSPSPLRVGRGSDWCICWRRSTSTNGGDRPRQHATRWAAR